MKRIFAILSLLLGGALTTSCGVNGPTPTPSRDVDSVAFAVRLAMAPESTRAGEELPDVISGADIYLFDENRAYVENKVVNVSDLEAFYEEYGYYGTTFDVVPGIYHVVGWANTDANSTLSKMTKSSLMDKSYIEVKGETSGDPIFYAPAKSVTMFGDPTRGMSMYRSRAEEVDYSIYAYEVIDGAENIKDIAFMDAHRQINVFLGGYRDTKYYDGKAPVVEHCAASTRYDFLLRADATLGNVPQTCVHDLGDGYYEATFYSAIIPLADGMGVRVYQPTTNELIAEIHFDDYMVANGLTDDCNIDLYVTFSTDGSFDVAIPGWNDNPIEY